MNVKYFSDFKFIEHLRTSINKAKIDSLNIVDKHKVWDYIKCIIRTECINFSIQKCRENKEIEKNLVERIKYLEEKIDDSPDIALLENLTLVKRELDLLCNEKAKGAIIRSRCQWIDENEKCTKFFLNQEKMNYNIKHIKSLNIESNLITDPVEILEMEKKFYENLYSEKNHIKEPQIQTFLNKITSPKISEESRVFCDEDITENEIAKAIKDLPNKKAPGPDGIPIEFYKVFWKDIKEILFENFKKTKDLKLLPTEQRKGIINLIPKDGKDIRELKNWRPITLLNSDYKILSKVLANRLKITLPEIINTDQIGYMKERFCGENTRLIADIIEYSLLYKHPGVILLIDFEKAFDTIKWSFLYKVLEYFNFGPNIVDWIKILYNKIFSCVTNNGYASSDINILRGIRQGDPISALLFLPVGEILALLIRNNIYIKGYMFYDLELKLCQLADDTTLFLCDNKSVKIALQTFEEFYRYAGLKLNVNKTEATIVYNDGTLYMDKTLGINWNEKPFKTLGIWYSLDISEMLEINILDKLRKMQSILNLWGGRCLSLKGKITVIKSLVMPHILHISSVLYIDDDIVKKIDKMFYDFLWSNRKHGISKITLEQTIEMGGLKMINIKKMVKSIRIMWVKRLLNNFDSKWKKVSWILLGITKEQLFSKLKIDFIKCNITFYRQILECWYSVVSSEPITDIEVREENLFDNCFILVDNKPLGIEFNILKQANIFKIGDLLMHDSSSLKSMDILYEKHGIKLSFLYYNSLKSAIPKRWIRLVENKVKESKNNSCEKILTQQSVLKLTNKKMYNYFLSQNSSIPCSQEKWIEIYPFLESAPWGEIYKLPFLICRDTYIQTLQYKILHRYLNCNYNLYTWSIKQNSHCDYCESIDTIEHYLYECSRVKLFWNGVKNWFKGITNVGIEFTYLEIAFGTLEIGNLSFVRNFIILQGKKFLYTNNKKASPLFLMEFLYKLKTVLITEKEIYTNEGKITLFEDRFGIMEDFI